jgi:CRP/FNR family cyclic AMP-dependent transcriptional regulator
MSTPNLEELLAGLPSALAASARAGVVRRYAKRTILISEGEPGTSLYIVLSGKLKIFTSDPDGKEFLFDVYGRGEIVGEMAIDGDLRSASVEAVEDTVCASVPLDAFRSQVKSDPDFAFDLILTLIRRSRHATSHARSLALESAYERLAALLQAAAVEENGETVISEELSQQDLADRIGTSRDMVSKIFKELKKGGYLSYEKKRVVLHRPLPARW